MQKSSSSARRRLGGFLLKFPYPLIIIVVFLFFGLTLHLWHPAWMLFLTIPIYYHFAGACRTGNKKAFALALPVPEIIILLYLLLGFSLHLWGSSWWLFLVIPIYYWSAAVFIKKS